MSTSLENASEVIPTAASEVLAVPSAAAVKAIAEGKRKFANMMENEVRRNEWPCRRLAFDLIA